MPFSSTVFSVSAPVGHSFTQAPHETQLDVANAVASPIKVPAPAAGLDENPRPNIVKACVP
jgi:hypothetical protein